MHTLIRTSLAATIGTACLLAVLGLLGAPAPAAIDPETIAARRPEWIVKRVAGSSRLLVPPIGVEPHARQPSCRSLSSARLQGICRSAIRTFNRTCDCLLELSPRA